MRQFYRETKETRQLKSQMLAMHPSSSSWRESVMNLYRDELDEFVSTATTPYKRVMFERDWEAMRKFLRVLVNKPILLSHAVTV